MPAAETQGVPLGIDPSILVGEGIVEIPLWANPPEEHMVTQSFTMAVRSGLRHHSKDTLRSAFN